MDECKLAIIQLKEDGSTIDFEDTISYSNYPIGCFLHAGSSNTGIAVYWNTDKSGTAEEYSKAICKIGSM